MTFHARAGFDANNRAALDDPAYVREGAVRSESIACSVVQVVI